MMLGLFNMNKISGKELSGFREITWPLTFTKRAIFDANGMFVRYRCWLQLDKDLKMDNITGKELTRIGKEIMESGGWTRRQ